MSGSAIQTSTYQAVNGNIANDGTADSPRGYAISDNAPLAMTIANTRVYVTATNANRTVTLPTTSVKAGMVVEVATACTSPHTIAINSSGANLIDTLKGTKGKISLMALQDAPTAAAHWRVMDVYDEGTYVPTVTSETGSPGTVSATGRYSRAGGVVQCDTVTTITTKSTAGGDVIISLPLTMGGNSVGIGTYTGGLTCRAVKNTTTSMAVRDLTNTTIWADSRLITMTYVFNL